MLFNEPKLLKCIDHASTLPHPACFSALQRAEIAEMRRVLRAPVAEEYSFSALQRAEIAEIRRQKLRSAAQPRVSVLFNEPKLLKFAPRSRAAKNDIGFSALQRAEIAEINRSADRSSAVDLFQCSSTSRNC